MDITMPHYKDWAPTGFDAQGLNADRLGIADHYVLLGHNRDSDLLSESNWDTALRMLGGCGPTVQIHRFRHWGPGWIEIILIDPCDADKVTIAQSISDALECYPVLDDEDFSRRETERATELGLTPHEAGGWITADGEQIDTLE